MGRWSMMRCVSAAFARFAILALAAISTLSGADISVQIVDGLDRPLPGVKIEISCVSDQRKTTPLRFTSDQNGMVHGTYDAAVCKPQSASVEKAGYQSYFSG